jgi:hypothetical protein
MQERTNPWLWKESDFPAEGAFAQMTFCLRYALLAPSSHNAQPWFFTAHHGELLVFADRSRALPVVDPDDRELVISCGALIGQLGVALSHFGLTHTVTLLPDRHRPDLMARVALTDAPRHAPSDEGLFAAILERRTTRVAFEERPVPREIVLALETEGAPEGVLVRSVHNLDDRHLLCDLVEQGDRIQFADRRFRRELAAWVHANRSRVRDGMPGAALGLGDLASAIGPTILRTFDTGAGRAARDRQLAEGSPLLCAIVTDEDRPRAWLEAGRVLTRVLLRATSHGLTASFLNQPIEVPELRPRLREAIGCTGEPQILLRIGYGPKVPHTSRRPLEEVLLLD